jgi:hypothetical protein
MRWRRLLFLSGLLALLGSCTGSGCSWTNPVYSIPCMVSGGVCAAGSPCPDGWQRDETYPCGCCLPPYSEDSSFTGGSPTSACARLGGTCSSFGCATWTIESKLCGPVNQVCCAPTGYGSCDGLPCRAGCACAPTQVVFEGCFCPDGGLDGGVPSGLDAADDLGAEDVASEAGDTGAQLETGTDGAPDGEASADGEAGGVDAAPSDAGGIPCGVITCVDGCTCANPHTSACVCP